MPLFQIESHESRLSRMEVGKEQKPRGILHLDHTKKGAIQKGRYRTFGDLHK